MRQRAGTISFAIVTLLALIAGTPAPAWLLLIGMAYLAVCAADLVETISPKWRIDQ